MHDHHFNKINKTIAQIQTSRNKSELNRQSLFMEIKSSGPSLWSSISLPKKLPLVFTLTQHGTMRVAMFRFVQTY